jgi:hypothetical protein
MYTRLQKLVPGEWANDCRVKCERVSNEVRMVSERIRPAFSLESSLSRRLRDGVFALFISRTVGCRYVHILPRPTDTQVGGFLDE